MSLAGSTDNSANTSSSGDPGASRDGSEPDIYYQASSGGVFGELYDDLKTGGETLYDDAKAGLKYLFDGTKETIQHGQDDANKLAFGLTLGETLLGLGVVGFFGFTKPGRAALAGTWKAVKSVF